MRFSLKRKEEAKKEQKKKDLETKCSASDVENVDESDELDPIALLKSSLDDFEPKEENFVELVNKWAKHHKTFVKYDFKFTEPSNDKNGTDYYSRLLQLHESRGKGPKPRQFICTATVTLSGETLSSVFRHRRKRQAKTGAAKKLWEEKDHRNQLVRMTSFATSTKWSTAQQHRMGKKRSKRRRKPLVGSMAVADTLSKVSEKGAPPKKRPRTLETLIQTPLDQTTDAELDQKIKEAEEVLNLNLPIFEGALIDVPEGEHLARLQDLCDRNPGVLRFPEDSRFQFRKVQTPGGIYLWRCTVSVIFKGVHMKEVGVQPTKKGAKREAACMILAALK